MGSFFEDIGFPALFIIGIITTIAVIIGAAIFGVQLYNQHNAPLAFAQCAQMCGPIGVHTANPDYKCECNETHRFEGKPSLDLNIRQEGK